MPEAGERDAADGHMLFSTANALSACPGKTGGEGTCLETEASEGDGCVPYVALGAWLHGHQNKAEPMLSESKSAVEGRPEGVLMALIGP